MSASLVPFAVVLACVSSHFIINGKTNVMSFVLTLVLLSRFSQKTAREILDLKSYLLVKNTYTIRPRRQVVNCQADLLFPNDRVNARCRMKIVSRVKLVAKPLVLMKTDIGAEST